MSLLDAFKSKKDCQIKPLLLLVLDGFGLAPEGPGNAIFLAKTPNLDRIIKEYPMGELVASGESVGLPANEVGNTEVGHLTMGAGRPILQDLKRISLAVKDGSILENQSLLAAANHVKNNQSTLHLMGLIGTGRVHASRDHLYGILDFCVAKGISGVQLHLFTDGRDSHPKACLEVVGEIEEYLSKTGVGRIASLTGRYYAMDRDRRWDRIQETYDMLTLGKGEEGTSAKDILSQNYSKDITDEFIKPTIILSPIGEKSIIKDQDATIFFNFRTDRPVQLTSAFVLKEFEKFRSFEAGFDAEGNLLPVNKEEFSSTFAREKVVQDLFFVTMTEYHLNLPVSAVAFSSKDIAQTLGEVISLQGLKQLRLAETEKEHFVTYYFSGLHDGQFEGEDWHMVPSPKVATYDKKPEMSIYKLYDTFVDELHKCKYHLFVMNWANADMVAHSGNLPATIKAIEHIDVCLGKLEAAMAAANGTIIITADHGNAEELLLFEKTSFFYTSDSGKMNTQHSYNKIPCLIINPQLKNSNYKVLPGTLADIAPTILSLFGLEKPESMTGRNLLTKG